MKELLKELARRDPEFVFDLTPGYPHEWHLNRNHKHEADYASSPGRIAAFTLLLAQERGVGPQAVFDAWMAMEPTDPRPMKDVPLSEAILLAIINTYPEPV